MIAVPSPTAGSPSTARSSARTTSTRPSSGAPARRSRRPGRPGRDRRRLRRQGGIPLDHRAARRAPRAQGRPPVRMIYDRHEDIAATTKRHPAIVRHRTGVAARRAARRPGHRGRHGRRRVLHADPVVLSRGAIHAGGPYDCPSVRIRGRAMATNTPPNGAFRGFGAPQVRIRRRDADEPHCRASGPESRSRSAGATSIASGDETPTGQILRDSVAGEEVLERAAEASRVRAGPRRNRTSGARSDGGRACGRPGRPR